jgi:hypothetical protein
MEYTQLTDSDKQSLINQRILSLEADHYKLELLIQESTDPERSAQLIEQQATLRSALDVHFSKRGEHTDQVQTAASP